MLFDVMLFDVMLFDVMLFSDVELSRSLSLFLSLVLFTCS